MSDIYFKYVRSIEVEEPSVKEQSPSSLREKPVKRSSLKQGMIVSAVLIWGSATFAWTSKSYQTEQNLAVITYATVHNCKAQATDTAGPVPLFACKENGEWVSRSLKDIQKKSMEVD